MMMATPSSSSSSSSKTSKGGRRMKYCRFAFTFVAIICLACKQIVQLSDLSFAHLEAVEEEVEELSSNGPALLYHPNNKEEKEKETKKQNKPTLWIHAGPPKTATTTVQQFLTRYKNTTLPQDTYQYMGTFLPPIKGQELEWNVIRLWRDKNCFQPSIEILKQAKKKKTKIKNSNAAFEGTTSATTASSSSNRTLELDQDLRETIIQNVSCWIEIIKELEIYEQSNISLIWMDEVLAFTSFPLYDWLQVLKIIFGGTWNISLVVTYRRFVDQLPSCYQQRVRWSPTKPALRRWPSQGGRQYYKSLFPKNIWKSIPCETASSMIQRGKGGGGGGGQQFVPTGTTTTTTTTNDDDEDDDWSTKTIIMNLHSPSSSPTSTTTTTATTSTQSLSLSSSSSSSTPNTIFACDILSSPSANYTCMASKELDHQESTISANPSQTLDYDILVQDAAASQLELNLLVSLDHINRRRTVIQTKQFHETFLLEYYNTEYNKNTTTSSSTAPATGTGTRTGTATRMIGGEDEDTTTTATTNTTTTRTWMTSNNNTIENNKRNQHPFQFPLLCPNRIELEEFLEYSLQLEKELLPTFYTTIHGEVEHRTNFWYNVYTKQKYCWIDTKLILQQDIWKLFFQNIFHPSTSRKKKDKQSRHNAMVVARDQAIKEFLSSHK